MTKLRTALIGCGAVARDEHLPALADMDDVEVVALCDRDAARAQSLASRHRVPRTFTSLETLLQETRPDLVHVLTPPESHKDVAISALEAGAHVLIEKPFTYDVSDADAVVATAERCGRKLTVVHNDLFHHGIREMKDRIEAGAVGQVCRVMFMSGRRDQTFIPDRWYFSTYGGRLGETLPHALYQLVEFFDDLEVKYVAVRKLGQVIPPPGVDATSILADELVVELWSQGRSASAHITYSMNFELPPALIVAGTAGSLFVHPDTGASAISNDPPGLRDMLKTLPAWGDAVRRRVQARTEKPEDRIRASTHYRQIREFVTSILAGTPYSVTPRKAREVVRLWADVVMRYAGER
ncbi:MAG: Gfo/Idh/MocA family oxidoreductase [Deltaproteobacteria bacterium]|nr:Gfo/Idh/MocA family oxidoreductase [Deltaproteobacteria bacterium]